MSEYDPGYLNELAKPEPYGVKISNDGAQYLKGLLSNFWQPQTEFYSIIEKIIVGRRTSGSPFYPDEVKNVKKG